jgi:hypothetical protein
MATMTSRGIDPIGRPGPGVPKQPHDPPPGRGPGAQPSPRPQLDEVVLTGKRVVALRLLRERVLENTRLLLDLPRDPRGIGFAEPTVAEPRHWAGRLVSDQNLLGGRRAQDWTAEQIRAALDEGLDQGLAETLEILHEVGDLDEETWDLVRGVMAVLQRR